jgi:hypothetical protein
LIASVYAEGTGGTSWANLSVYEVRKSGVSIRIVGWNARNADNEERYKVDEAHGGMKVCWSGLESEMGLGLGVW